MEEPKKRIKPQLYLKGLKVTRHLLTIILPSALTVIIVQSCGASGDGGGPRNPPPPHPAPRQRAGLSGAAWRGAGRGTSATTVPPPTPSPPRLPPYPLPIPGPLRSAQPRGQLRAPPRRRSAQRRARCAGTACHLAAVRTGFGGKRWGEGYLFMYLSIRLFVFQRLSPNLGGTVVSGREWRGGRGVRMLRKERGFGEGSASLQVADGSPVVGEHSGAGSSITPQPGWSWVLADFGVTGSQVSPIAEKESYLGSCSDSIILGLCCTIEMFSFWGFTVISHSAAPSFPVQPQAAGPRQGSFLHRQRTAVGAEVGETTAELSKGPPSSCSGEGTKVTSTKSTSGLRDAHRACGCPSPAPSSTDPGH